MSVEMSRVLAYICGECKQTILSSNVDGIQTEEDETWAVEHLGYCVLAAIREGDAIELREVREQSKCTCPPRNIQFYGVRVTDSK